MTDPAAPGESATNAAALREAALRQRLAWEEKGDGHEEATAAAVLTAPLPEVDEPEDEDCGFVLVDYDPPVLRLCYDIFGEIQSFLDDNSLLQMRLVCMDWGNMDRATWRAVSLSMKQLRREGKKHKAGDVALGAARTLLGGVGVVAGTAAAGALAIYGGEPGVHAAILLVRFVVLNAANCAGKGVDKMRDASDGIDEERVREVKASARETDDFDMTDQAFQVRGSDVIVVTESQRWSVWNKEYTANALTTRDPPPFECPQFPGLVTSGGEAARVRGSCEDFCRRGADPAECEALLSDDSAAEIGHAPGFHLQLPDGWKWDEGSQWSLAPPASEALQEEQTAREDTEEEGSGPMDRREPEVVSSDPALAGVHDTGIVGSALRFVNAPPAPAQDEEGWVYSAGFRVGRPNGRRGHLDFVRWRQWRRVAVQE